MKTVKQQGLSTLQRPRFSPGLLLEDEDLTTGVDYTRNLTRLLFKSFFGCGVVCGLKVEAKLICQGTQVELGIKPGLALDCEGNPINIQKSQTARFGEHCEDLPKELWVSVCHIEKCCRPRDISCMTDDDSAVHTRIYDGFEIKLYPVDGKRPGCLCSCLPKVTPNGPTRFGCCDPEDGAASTAGTDPYEEISRVKPTDPTPEEQVRKLRESTCGCYDSHYEGKCECGCDCCCVLLGVIVIPDEANRYRSSADNEHRELVPLESTDWMVRRIRPVLAGSWECLVSKEVTRQLDERDKHEG